MRITSRSNLFAVMALGLLLSGGVAFAQNTGANTGADQAPGATTAAPGSTAGQDTTGTANTGGAMTTRHHTTHHASTHHTTRHHHVASSTGTGSASGAAAGATGSSNETSDKAGGHTTNQ